MLNTGRGINLRSIFDGSVPVKSCLKNKPASVATCVRENFCFSLLVAVVGRELSILLSTSAKVSKKKVEVEFCANNNGSCH